MPLSYYFGVYLGNGNPGLFLGITIGNVITVTLYTIYILQQDWDQIALEVKGRMHEWEERHDDFVPIAGSYSAILDVEDN